MFSVFGVGGLPADNIERVEVLSGLARDAPVLAEPLVAEPGSRARPASGR